MRILLSGCSFVVGKGLANTKADENNAFNLFTKSVFGCGSYNIAQIGYSNQSIYFDTAKEMYKRKYDYVFVGVTSYPRYNFFLGTEIDDFRTRINFIPNTNISIGRNKVEDTFPQKMLEDVSKKFLVLHQDHHEIVKILQYQDLLINQANQLGTKIYFINNLAHWDKNFFKKIRDTDHINTITDYTKTIIGDVTKKSDKAIAAQYNMLHNDYIDLKQSHWINLYEPFSNHIIDHGIDGFHPGIESHKNFGSLLISRFNHITNPRRNQG